jgi:hypothetical protein
MEAKSNYVNGTGWQRWFPSAIRHVDPEEINVEREKHAGGHESGYSTSHELETEYHLKPIMTSVSRTTLLGSSLGISGSFSLSTPEGKREGSQSNAILQYSINHSADPVTTVSAMEAMNWSAAVVK